MTILFSFVWQITMSTNHTAIETTVGLALYSNIELD